MFQRMSVPVIGLVENMTAFVCPHCGEVTEIFGRGGGERFAAEHDLEYLGGIPLDITVRQGGDVGVPAVAQREPGPGGRALTAIAQIVAARMSVRAAQAAAQPVLTDLLSSGDPRRRPSRPAGSTVRDQAGDRRPDRPRPPRRTSPRSRPRRAGCVVDEERLRAPRRGRPCSIASSASGGRARGSSSAVGSQRRLDEQQVGAAGELDHRVARPGVAGVDEPGPVGRLDDTPQAGT